MRFTARHGTHAFLGGRDLDEVVERSRKMKALAAAEGRTVRTYTSLTLIVGDTDDEAVAILDRLRAGADAEALENIMTGMAARPSGDLVREMARRFVFFGCQPLLGSPATIARRLHWLAHDGGLDGVMFCFPDFLEGLRDFRDRLLPWLNREGIMV